jgi:amicyanin
MRNTIVLAFLTAAIVLFSGCASTDYSGGKNTKTLPDEYTTAHSSIPNTGQESTIPQDTTIIQSGETTTTKASSRTTTTRAGAKTIEVDIKGFAFDPKTIAITKGDTVVWTNTDAAPHRAISDVGSAKDELDSPILAKGDTYSHTFKDLGTYAYHCSIHTSMKGKIIVD